MFIRLEPASGVPITRQIADQIRLHCANGALAPGDRLPSVRELARDLAINQNTVLRVYERLTADGLLERRHGDGTYVSDHLPGGQFKAQKQLLADEIQRVVSRAAQLGVDQREFTRLAQQAYAKLKEVTA